MERETEYRVVNGQKDIRFANGRGRRKQGV